MGRRVIHEYCVWHLPGKLEEVDGLTHLGISTTMCF
jgi:hypothetical protein